MTGSSQPRGRPPASSREEIEAKAIALFLERGFAATTVTAIAAACGVSKTSFFRYYSSKSDIVWLAFDVHIARLRSLLAESDPSVPALTAVRLAVVEALTGDADEQGIWMRRFRLIDTSPELRDGESAHWILWADAVSDFLVERIGCPADHVVPPVVSGAVQSLFLAQLRSWLPLSEPAGMLTRRLDAELGPLCEALQPWVDESCGAPVS
ncbi:hypothetical protein B7R54_13880 [Subtercola boreus]|uniref:HTH tetR-type domain-containing protein n=1 Tax=Subtercola boreus TaxID=120213 RepID=A0A3E0VKL7_9MICO|nr:TetR family transcriptional regulator [Subtercola boreus]RFA10175.1 hypothetical protein B7R54_13880 [Subtercola boreus]TQL52659.1 TetR family transcriptional regulator [Subtercola boreus]